MAVTVSISDSFDGGNIEVISVSEPVVSAGGRTAKCTVTVHVKPGEFVRLQHVMCMQFQRSRTP